MASALFWGAVVTGCSGSGTSDAGSGATGAGGATTTSGSLGVGGAQTTSSAGMSASTSAGESSSGQGGAGGMVGCKEVADCNDSDLCTDDACTAGLCAHTAVKTEDGNPCTMDVCDKTSGVTHPLLSVDDNDACTTDSCDPGSGVHHVAIATTDNNACTADACDAATGLVTHTTIAPTPDANGCTSELCIPATGETTHTPIVGCQCKHSLCAVGTALDAAACTWQLPGVNDDCAAKVCAADGFCCGAMGGTWDTSCVDKAKDPAICPTVGTAGFSCGCSHSYCTTGAALANLCDPCVKKICELNPTCCTTAWDAQCVSATHSICQVPAGAACL